MKAAEFFKKYSVVAQGTLVGEYALPPVGAGDTRTRQVWGLMLTFADPACGYPRVLRLTLDTGRAFELDWDDVLDMHIRDAVLGSMSFPEFVGEGMGQQQPLAMEQHRLWIGCVFTLTQIDEWLGSDVQMRADFYSITEE